MQKYQLNCSVTALLYSLLHTEKVAGTFSTYNFTLTIYSIVLVLPETAAKSGAGSHETNREQARGVRRIQTDEGERCHLRARQGTKGDVEREEKTLKRSRLTSIWIIAENSSAMSSFCPNNGCSLLMSLSCGTARLRELQG